MKLYYKTTFVNRGGAKLMFGTNEIQKLMKNNELVYNNALPVGTILFDGYYTVPESISELELPLVKEDWSNVSSKLKISWSTSYTFDSMVLSKDELLTPQPFTGYIKGSISRNVDKNSLIIDAVSYNWKIIKVELV